MRYLLSCLLLLTALSTPAAAEDLLQRDSVYYTMDDGIMTPEEMELEANQIYKQCQINHFQKDNLKCDCIAGAFLLQREKLGPMVPQTVIFDDITKKNPVAECANTDKIAGYQYTSCMEQVAPRRPMQKDNPQYCECVANKVARDYAKQPFLNDNYINNLTYDSMLFCEKPENRSKKTAAKTAN